MFERFGVAEDLAAKRFTVNQPIIAHGLRPKGLGDLSEGVSIRLVGQVTEHIAIHNLCSV